MKIRCPNPSCNIKFKLRPGQKKCFYCGTFLFGEKAGRPTDGRFICTNCGCVGEPLTRVKGSFLIEVVLWLFMILPGILYSLWRLTTKEKVCPACGSPAMILTTTPKGRDLLERYKKT